MSERNGVSPRKKPAPLGVLAGSAKLMNSRVPAMVWSTNRVTMLGDAVHSTLPYMAQGAAMAFEDAAVIAELGHFALWLAVGVTLVLSVVPMLGAQRGRLGGEGLHRGRHATGGVLAIGQLLVIVTRGIDLSVGSALALGTVTGALAASSGAAT